MSKEEILRKAIEKAQSNGWCEGMSSIILSTDTIQLDVYYTIIFNHKFARAFWGERKSDGNPEWTIPIVYNEGWQYHLTQMVLEEDPLTYLAKFLDNEEAG